MFSARIKRSAFHSAALLVVMGMVIGCGSKTSPSSESVEPDIVTGKVQFNGKLVNYGTVSLFDDAGKRVGKGVIMADGNYSVRNTLPRAEVKIVVDTSAVPIPASGGGEGPPIKFEKINIPAKYSDPEKTDLRYTVIAGKQTFDIEMKSDPKPGKP
jgi:hypothetical protein